MVECSSAHDILQVRRKSRDMVEEIMPPLSQWQEEKEAMFVVASNPRQQTATIVEESEELSETTSREAHLLPTQCSQSQKVIAETRVTNFH